MDSIKKSSDFQLIAKSGEKWISDSFILQVKKRDTEADRPCRIGLVVSKKLGNAVRRNFIKRRFREIFRLSLPSQLQGLDMVFIGRHSSVECDLPKMQKDLLWSLKRLGIIA